MLYSCCRYLRSLLLRSLSAALLSNAPNLRTLSVDWIVTIHADYACQWCPWKPNQLLPTWPIWSQSASRALVCLLTLGSSINHAFLTQRHEPQRSAINPRQCLFQQYNADWSVSIVSCLSALTLLSRSGSSTQTSSHPSHWNCCRIYLNSKSCKFNLSKNKLHWLHAERPEV